MIQKAFLVVSVLFLTSNQATIAHAGTTAVTAVPATTTASATTAAAPVTNCKAKSEESYPLISSGDLQKALAANTVTTIDANSTDSFKEAHIGKKAIHFGDHSKDLAKLLPADKSTMIVAYCGGPACTAWHKAATAACNAGYTNIYHYKDGISGWKKLNNISKM
jgi:rhodanese-related sulfurtransferase